MNFILARKGLSLAANFIGEVDLLFLGHKAQHAHHARHHGREVDALRLGQHAAVQTRQSQQIFRDARQALGLLLDIADKFAHGLRVHVLRLQNGVGQKPDARQRRFELVARVRHEAAASVLRRLQPVSHVVELGGEFADLVVPADLGAVAVRALAHLADGVGQYAEAPRQHTG